MNIFWLALWLSAAPSPAAVKNPDTFTLAEIGEVASLDPAFPYDAASQGLLLNVYETLIGYDSPALDRFSPRLAAKVPSLGNGLLSKDGLTYRFPIRPGVKFQDGSLVTAQDARYSLLRFMLMDRAGGPSALLLEPILGVSSTRDSSGKITLDFSAAERAVRVEGDQLVVRLARPFGPFLSIMARWSYVLPKAWAVSHGEWDGTESSWKAFNNPEKEKSYLYDHALGAGPFKVERWDRTGRYVLLARHDGYWRGPAALRRVLVKSVPELSTRKLMLQAGDADLIETPRPYLSQLQGMEGVRVSDGLRRLTTDPALFFTFDINPSANPDIGSGKLDGEGIPPDFFSDADVRKGFGYAFDYEALLRDTFKGTARRALGPIPPSIPGHDPSQPHFTYDLKKAEEYLRRAWGGKAWEKGFKFTMTYNTGSENREAACQILKKNIESLNPRFRVDLRGVDWAAYLDKAQRRMMPVFSRGWVADYPDAHNFVYAFYHSAGRYPSAQAFSDPELDGLISLAAVEVSPKKRQALYKRVLRLGHERAPSIVTVHPAGVYAMRDWVKGFYDNAVFMGVYYYPIRKE
jgi:peptide/nickel transport system substrate-binding protein